MERWMTTAEVAEWIGVTRQTVARWIRDGRLKARRIELSGGRSIYRVRRADLIRFAREYIRDL